MEARFNLGIEVPVSRGAGTILVHHGVRIDKKIISDGDYFFYHFCRLLDMAIRVQVDLEKADYARRMSIAENEELLRANRSDSDAELRPHSYVLHGRPPLVIPMFEKYQIVKYTGDHIDSRVKRNLQDVPWQFQHYVDDTGFKSLHSLSEVKALVGEIVTTLHERFNPMRSVRLISFVRIILSTVTDPLSYYYNYIPSEVSEIPIMIAFSLGWHRRWFQIPTTYLHINEWNFLLSQDLNLFEIAQSRTRRFQLERSYLHHLICSLHHDQSGRALVLSRDDLSELCGIAGGSTTDLINRLEKNGGADSSTGL